MDFIDGVAIGASTAASTITIVGVVHNIRTARTNKRENAATARTAEEALEATRRTADAIARLAKEAEAVRTLSEDSAATARDAAVSARRSAEEAAKVAGVQLASQHRDLEPQITIEYKLSGPGPHRDLMGHLRVTRDYRVRAVAKLGNSSWNLGLPLLLTANKTHVFSIEKWPPGRYENQADSIVFKFWPPVDADPVEHWTCPCGRPVVETTEDQEAHWERTVEVSFQQRRPPATISEPPKGDFFGRGGGLFTRSPRTATSGE